MKKSTIDPAILNTALATTQDLSTTLTAYRGKKIVLYFYPKDNTPGCTRETQEFRDLYAEFQKLNTVIFGISRDDLHSHQKFKTQHNVPFELISDQSEVLCQAFNVIRAKGFFGKTIFGLERSTFLLDEEGQLVHSWRKVKAQGHAQNVLEMVKTLI